ncbi:forkhead box protein I3-like [Mytilus edulis]|uniref:forkhead box protein I3-like n=1 Tax=Mytilus edulis TaxID=6550 RepID=UPI0039F09E97
MNNSHLSSYYLTRGDTERVKRDSFSSEGDELWTPSLCTSESESSLSDSNESIAQVQLCFDRSIKNILPSSITNKKPSHSYIAMISMAILSKPNKKLVLNDIYQYIIDNFPFYNNKEKAWRNSIRHNLSLNECFVKNGRSDNGKGNYWSIHKACIEDFAKGDFRRRNARRRARKSSVKTVDGSSNQFYTRSNNGYVPMTSSPIGFYPYSMKGSFMHKKPHNSYQITQSTVSTFGMTRTQFPATMHSFGSDSIFPVSQSLSGGQSFIAPSTY